MVASLHGCCKGKPTNLPWAVYRKYDITRVHPAEIYDALAFGISFILINILKGKVSDSARLAISVLNYVVLRALIENTYYQGVLFGGIESKIIYICTILICIYIILKSFKENSKN